MLVKEGNHFAVGSKINFSLGPRRLTETVAHFGQVEVRKVYLGN